MGVKDLDALHEIYEILKAYCKKYKLPFKFTVDDGSFETAIEFWAMGYHHPPKSKDWEESKKNGTKIKCPDILDFEHRLIIEYEEEPKPGKKGGKLGKKGHTEESSKDQHRDQLYRIAGFKLLKIWESEFKDGSWIKKLNIYLNNNSLHF